MRCDVNISLHKEGFTGQRVEIKNVLGIRFIEKAIEYEIQRQSEIYSQGGKVSMETRRYDALQDKTIFMRSKEIDLDYRFLHDCDLPYVQVDPNRVSVIQ